MKGWRDYLEREGKEESDKSFKILTNLFINDDEAILGLESIRLNPNLVSENKLRNDLEFYIPQLCTFLLFGEMKDIEEFFVFLCKACNLSFFFAHRVHWFLSAMLEDSQTKKDSIINIIKMINTIFKSENEESKNIINRLYVSNSEALISYIKKNNLYFLYDIKNIENNKINMLEKIDEQNLKGRQLKLFSKYKKSKDIILNYSEKEYLKTTEKNIESKEIEKNNENIKKLENSDEINELNQKLKANDFLITISNFELNNNNDDLFEEENDDNLNEEEENEEGKNEEKNEKPKKKNIGRKFYVILFKYKFYRPFM
jgi:phosphatidylinositol 4-kinase